MLAFNITHLLFYTGGVVLTYFFFLSIARNRFWALVGAALFSSHALHVEPVACEFLVPVQTTHRA